MKLLILTGIFPPEVGGPSRYAEKLSEKLDEKGIEVKILCYSDEKPEKEYSFPVRRLSKRYPLLLRNFLYFFILLKPIIQADIVYVLSTSPGIAFLPLILGKIFAKPILVRPGSDFLWDRATQNEKVDLALPEYYQARHYQKNKLLYFIFKYLIKNADKVIFPTLFLSNLYQKYYGLKEEKTAICDYPFPEIEARGLKKISEPKEIITACRLIRFKNLPRLIEAFARIPSREAVLRIIGEGPEEHNLKERVRSLGAEDRIFFEKPLSHSELLKKIEQSYLVVIPSIFEPGSFLALECLKLKIPILFTQEAGLYDVFKDKLIFIDPFNVEDIKNKIEFLLKEENWKLYYQKISKLDTSRGWSDVAKDHLKIFEKL